jgi:hypothetical protein
MNSRFVSPGFALALTLGLAAACGGGAASGPGANVQPPPASSSSAPAPVASSASPASTSPGTVALPASMKLVTASTMVADLQSVGLDLKALPPLNKLTSAQNKKVMSTFSKALGWTCKDCHGTGNFEVSTPNKKVTNHMWNEYVRGATHASGALYCDSCHQGKAEFLDKSDKKALSAWMDQEYTKKLKRDGKDVSCATCHGEPFNPEIIAGWKK